jgi:natural product biosynthesis luciferase-like monooxygenase protein
MRFVALGEQTLLLQCLQRMHDSGHVLVAVVSRNEHVRKWCEQHGVALHDAYEALQSAVPTYDYLLSITNLRVLPQWLLLQPKKCAINFHDGPLPRYAGLNAPVWALLHGETSHGVSWHEMQAGVDRGRMLIRREFAVAPSETAFGLNAQCYQAGLESFAELLEALEHGALLPVAQDAAARSYFGLADRPWNFAILDWNKPAEILARAVAALDHGRYPNPVLLPRVDLGSTWALARQARAVEGDASRKPGEILSISDHGVTVACAVGSALQISRLTDLLGDETSAAEVLARVGLVLGSLLPSSSLGPHSEAFAQRCAGSELWWLSRCAAAAVSAAPFAQREGQGEAGWLDCSAASSATPACTLAGWLLLIARLNDRNNVQVGFKAVSRESLPLEFLRLLANRSAFTAAFSPDDEIKKWIEAVDAELLLAEQRIGWFADLPARYPDQRDLLGSIASSPICVLRCAKLPDIAVPPALAGAVLLIAIDDAGSVAIGFDGRSLDRVGATRLRDCYLAVRQNMSNGLLLCGEIPLLSDADQRLLDAVPVVAASDPRAVRIHEAIAAQVEAAPKKVSCIFGEHSVTYAELDARANRLAQHLISGGAQRGDLIGLNVPRSIDVVVGLLAILKVGAAYVPLDPSYPAERLAHMIEDAGLRVIVSRSDVLPAPHVLQRIDIDKIPDSRQLGDSVAPMVSGAVTDLAYVIYTSGSTGKPKGVMVQHDNVQNFFAGMDQRLGTIPGVWLAVTSISFDISVLELLWTLARGFTVVIQGDELRHKSRSRSGASRGPEFGLFYWNVASADEDHASDKYRLLLESARYADANGFNAVWTPERHFASFGGLYPNPAVTSAALATITKNVQLRAGSCVVPLHHPIRVAEEWAVVDNLSGGRVGISIAAGWASPDFALQPENFATAKQLMFDNTALVQRLWKGETIDFPGPHGPVKVRTLPRPIQKELPIWVTTAGNPETWIQAARMGANVLTHLLGQSLEEVAEKIALYRKVWHECNHPGRGVVTLMLHTLVGTSAEAVEAAVRKPFKNYLRSAVQLVKAAAWQFPTFKQMSAQQGKTLDEMFTTLPEQDMDDLLEFAFQRYFHTSGLFGTAEFCVEMIDRVDAAGVDEIACLIDYGVNTDTVLENLPNLARLKDIVRSSRCAQAEESLATLMQKHRVTHLQCTPTLATLLLADDDARAGLGALQYMLVGGEAMTPELARRLRATVSGRVMNMYGPTETTVWSSSSIVDDDAIVNDRSVTVGASLKNQCIYIMDSRQQCLPRGIVGEICIGGAGVTRGYLKRPELTAERFLSTVPASGAVAARIYRTGDLGRVLPDGRIECLGRSDNQVKIRGYRVELGEIEAALVDIPAVLEAAVVMQQLADGDCRLVAFLRTSDTGIDTQDVRSLLATKLPDFMIPSACHVLAALPQTPNGKVDRNALAHREVIAEREAQNVATDRAEPQSDAQLLVRSIWQRALGVDKIGLRDNFFDIGGHSLLVLQVLKELREQTGKTIQIVDLFRHTTIESLARFLDGDSGVPGVAAQRGRSRADARRVAMAKRN